MGHSYKPNKTKNPNPNYVPPASVKENCTYETPCGWCTKWDKKCDRKIGYKKEGSYQHLM